MKRSHQANSIFHHQLHQLHQLNVHSSCIDLKQEENVTAQTASIQTNYPTSGPNRAGTELVILMNLLLQAEKFLRLIAVDKLIWISLSSLSIKRRN